MATSKKTIKTTRGTWIVDINPDNIIGQGAYGIVYRGTDEKGKKIAAKRIHTHQKRGISEKLKDLYSLMELDHPNIVKVHDIHEEEGIVWIFMDLCEHGDLSTFFSKTNLTQEQLVDIMKQITSGIAYLHEHNIIHRDIKPENILIENASKIQVKLTDFDLSKFLDEYFDTSGMSTNVGTLAFKAPEFFQRNPDGKLRYHRAIDNYACGLTYLALLQALGKKKLLLPKIETPKEASDLNVLSIGQLIAERIKYNVPDLNIVNIAEKTGPLNAAAVDAPDTSIELGSYDTTTEIRKIILNMTQANPEDRWSAAQAVEALQSVEQNMMKAKFERIRLEEERRIQDLKGKFRDRRLNRASSWKSGMTGAETMCVVEDQLLLRGLIGGKVHTRIFNRNDGRVVKDIKSQCADVNTFNTVCEYPTNNNYFLESCSGCKQIRCYSINTGEAQTVYKKSVWEICPGPSGSVLCVDGEGRIEQLDTQGEGQEFRVKHSVQTGMIYVWGMCYVERYNIVVFTCYSPDRITAVSLSDGLPLWEFKQQVEGKNINPKGLCLDEDGRLYVTDLTKERLLIFAPQRGELLQVLPVNESHVWDVSWTNSPPQLSVLDRNGRNISVYDVKC